MTVLEQLKQQDASVANTVADLDAAFNAFTSDGETRSLEDLPRIVSKTFDQLTYNVLGGIVGQDPIRHTLGFGGPPGGIFGVGATRFKDELRPAVFLDLDFFGSGAIDDTVPISESEHRDSIERTLRKDVDREAVTVLLPRPRFFSEAVVVGSKLSIAEMSGVCGIEVDSAQHGRCLLTAGHVARNPGTSVRVNGRHIGTTVLADHARLHGIEDVIADVGVIKLNDDVTVQNPRGAIVQGQSKELDPVVADTLAGPESAWIRNVLTSFVVDREYGRLGNVLLTDKAISRKGDSGSPVYLEEEHDLGVATIVGHVVAGGVPVYTIVQDISYVLEYASVSLR